ncbi:MAG TPA: DUF4230 domain-containing protein [Vicinamibacterales bacterium]|jgi:hypothetical protein|nr:DUF4230 domain-containing protein [Vicinamibacterales bacterium]
MIKRIPSFLVGFALAAAMSAVALWVIRGSGLRIDISRPTVIHHIHELQRLETVVYGMDKIVSGGQESSYLPKLLAGDRLLLIVYGEVTAGVDLASVQNGQVDISGRSVVLSIPAAEIFTTRIDNDRTRVYARETGLFTRPDPNLESDVRREAEHQVRQAALDAGILKTATTNARGTLTTFLKGLGFDQVLVQ